MKQTTEETKAKMESIKKETEQCKDETDKEAEKLKIEEGLRNENQAKLTQIE